MATMYFNPTQKTFSPEPYMIKEHTVIQGRYAATTVVVPFASVTKKGVATASFVPMGIRIEHLARIVKGNWVLPGYSYFFRFKNGMVSETSCWTFNADRMGNPYMERGRPMLVRPTTKYAGVPLSEHKMGETFAPLIVATKAAYKDWRAEKRAA